VTLHGGAARQVYTTLAVNFGDHNHDLVANGDLILDGVHTVVGKLADTYEAFLAWKDLDEAAEAHDAGDLTHVERTELNLFGDPVDRIKDALGALWVSRSDLHGAVVLHVDVDLEVILQLADDRATLTNDVADLLRIDLDRGDAWSEIRELWSSGADDRVHLVEDLEARSERVLEHP